MKVIKIRKLFAKTNVCKLSVWSLNHPWVTCSFSFRKIKMKCFCFGRISSKSMVGSPHVYIVCKYVICYIHPYKCNMICKQFQNSPCLFSDIVHRDLKLDNILVSEDPEHPEDKLNIKVSNSIFKGSTMFRSGIS